jgi:ppGpp synthetase/RelA/SpoT-type nucleotidyltranferase
MSKNAIKMLGKRLATSSELSEEDLDQLEELTQCHSGILTVARGRLTDLSTSAEFGPVTITHRAKTTQTIIEKLQRQPAMDLARMQDLAGIRLVGPLSLKRQDALAQEIAQRFPANPREPRIVDRRAEPSWGYRAVHVVVSVEEVSVEVQVRTQRQHMWANLTELLGDRLGRGIRYGESTEVNNSIIETLAQRLQTFSDQLYELECDPQSAADIFAGGGVDPATAEVVTAFSRLVLLDESA